MRLVTYVIYWPHPQGSATKIYPTSVITIMYSCKCCMLSFKYHSKLTVDLVSLLCAILYCQTCWTRWRCWETKVDEQLMRRKSSRVTRLGEGNHGKYLQARVVCEGNVTRLSTSQSTSSIGWINYTVLGWVPVTPTIPLHSLVSLHYTYVVLEMFLRKIDHERIVLYCPQEHF